MKNPLLSIITINYNSIEETKELIHSIYNSSFTDYEIIVVNNSPNQNCKELINLEKTRLVNPNENLGFAGGNNFGTKYAQGELVLYINNDMEVTPLFLEKMVNCFQSNPNIGAASPKIKYYHTPGMIQYAGYNKMNNKTLTCTARGKNQIDSGQYSVNEKTEFIHGGAVITSKEVLAKAGFMPEEYFLYYEELSWGMQIKNAGYEMHYVADALVYHKESVSVGKNSPLKTYYMNRNRILFAQKHLESTEKLIALFYLFLVSFPVNFFRNIENKPNLSALVNAYKWHVKSLFTFKKIKSNEHSLAIN